MRHIAFCWMIALTLAQSQDLSLYYAEPAQKWSAEALPLGNGRLGAMVFGGVRQERIQFNEDSLWTGDTNPTGDYDKMGAYQNFGELIVSMDTAATETGVTCPSGHQAFYDHEEIEYSIDGRPDTKWCLEHKGRPVLWQATMPPRAPAVSSYSLTSCPDWPTRDPQAWSLAGSHDGQSWVVLDQRTDQSSFPERGRPVTFSFDNTTAYSFYRLTLLTNHGAAHFQLAEITLPGLEPPTGPASPNGYRRQLNLDTATARVTFTQQEVQHQREAFVSHPDQVMVWRWTANRPGAVGGLVELKGAHAEKTSAAASTLSFQGALDNGLRYQALAQIQTRGGTLLPEQGRLRLQGCDEALILLVAGTDYLMDAAAGFRGADPGPRLRRHLEQTASQSYETLRARHLEDHQRLFRRVLLDLGPAPAQAGDQPTSQRLAAYAQGTQDPALEALLFQYGRYLLMSSSRRPGLPANLQGLWNDSNKPPWSSDYHVNINVQMNYWPAEPANLPECHLPLFDLIQSQLQPWRQATQAEQEFHTSRGPARGWALRTSHNIHGGLGWKWDKTANAWYCQHLWEHYAFSLDKDFLANTAYPILKETCQFWEDHLKPLPDGRLVVPKGWSPEHGPEEDGVSYNQQLVFDLFSNYVLAADALQLDQPYRNQIASMRDRLARPQIGRWGQLQEWMTDRDNPNDQHRHTSHLFAVYPGRQISVAQTPDLAAAAAKSLEARGSAGDSRRSWTWPWRCALWARFGQAENAHRMVRGLLTHNILPNLFGNHPPFQMDGNFGYTAGVCEMLLQSHAGEVSLLPALPQAWANGSVQGLRARGGYEVNLSWRHQRLVRVEIRASRPGPLPVRYGDAVRTFTMEPGQSLVLDGDLQTL